ncbi:glycosyltransferase family 4 protein [Caulobacter sp.]|uniref:glycosyltransferase family 4 protein n=1 Tax=Caulobacter sp. TaxID=78 RepID=UPI003BAC0AF8
MRVLHVIADGAPGGGPTMVQTLCAQMAPWGVEPLIVTQADSPLHAQGPAAGLRTVGLDFASRAAGLRLAGQIARLAAQERIDLIHAHGARSALPAALMRRSERPPLVYTVHGFHYRRKPAPLRWLGREAERFCIRRAEATTFVSSGDEASARQERLLGAGRAVLIHNGVSVPPGLAVPDAQRRFDLAFVGRLHPQKDPLILPDILAAMRPARPSLLVVGGGPLEGALRERILARGVEAQVTLLPAMPRAEALAWLAQARVCVLPSLWEGLPISLAEAMLLDVCVAASRVEGNIEIVHDGQTGRLAPAGEAAGFAKILGELLAAPEPRAALAQAGRRFAEETFSPARQAQAFADLYARLLAVRAGAQPSERPE